jgi:hypothetical protein
LHRHLSNEWIKSAGIRIGTLAALQPLLKRQKRLATKMIDGSFIADYHRLYAE